MKETAKAQKYTDIRIHTGVIQYCRRICKHFKKRTNRKAADCDKQQISDQRQQQTMGHSAVCFLLILLSKLSCYIGIHPYTDSHGTGYYQRLYRKSQGNSRKCIFSNLCHKHTVYNVVQRLYQHGQHRRKSH